MRLIDFPFKCYRAFYYCQACHGALKEARAIKKCRCRPCKYLAVSKNRNVVENKINLDPIKTVG